MRAEAPSIINSEVNYEFSGRGEIYSYTTIYDKNHAPERFGDFIPYTLAWVRLEEGPLITAQLTDLDWHWETDLINGEDRQVKKIHVEIGMPVEMVTRLLMIEGDPDRGLRIYGPKFRPLLVTQDHSK